MLIDELRFLAIFATVVEVGSFRGAAIKLKLSPSVVSHHVGQLEERLGVTLLYRSTRQLSLTSEGQQLLVSANAMLLAAEQGIHRITDFASQPMGRLTITLPAFFSRSPMMKDIADFAKAFPKIELNLRFSDLQQDMIREGLDLAVRVGDLKDSTLKCKKIYDMERKLVASPSLITKHSSMKHPEDLLSWTWIGLHMRPNTKKLFSDKGQQYTIHFESSIVADSVDAACQLAIAGLGLATPPSFLVDEAIKNGALIEPLHQWKPEPLPVYLVWPSNANKESLTFRLIDFLAHQ